MKDISTGQFWSVSIHSQPRSNLREGETVRVQKCPWDFCTCCESWLDRQQELNCSRIVNSTVRVLCQRHLQCYVFQVCTLTESNLSVKAQSNSFPYRCLYELPSLFWGEELSWNLSERFRHTLYTIWYSHVMVSVSAEGNDSQFMVVLTSTGILTFSTRRVQRHPVKRLRFIWQSQAGRHYQSWKRRHLRHSFSRPAHHSAGCVAAREREKKQGWSSFFGFWVLVFVFCLLFSFLFCTSVGGLAVRASGQAAAYHRQGLSFVLAFPLDMWITFLFKWGWGSGGGLYMF